MSSALAIAVALALYAGVLLPLGWAAVSGRTASLGAFYATFILVIGAYNTGIFHTASLTSHQAVSAAPASVGDAQCQQLVELLEQSGLTIDRSNPAEPTITGAGSNRLPAEVQGVLVECFARQADPAISATPIEAD